MYDIVRAECEDAISRFFHPVNIVIELQYIKKGKRNGQFYIKHITIYLNKLAKYSLLIVK